jgi:hypothetical protein
MPVGAKDKRKQFAERIEGIFRSGIHVGPAVIGYIEATFSNPSAVELEEILKDESNCERDVLLELIFFPDERLQAQLEEFLEENVFTEEETERIRKDLLSKKIEAKIIFANPRQTIGLRVPQSIFGPFLSRLNISRKIDLQLRAAICKYVADSDRMAVKIKIRNAPSAPAGDKVDFLCRFFQKMHADATFMASLEFVLEFFTEIKDEADIYDALMARKKSCFDQLKKMEKFEQALKKNNIETLMLRGEKMPYVDKSDVLKTIAMIDRVSLMVFGRTDAVLPAEASAVSFGNQPQEDLIDMIRKLS